MQIVRCFYNNSALRKSSQFATVHTILAFSAFKGFLREAEVSLQHKIRQTQFRALHGNEYIVHLAFTLRFILRVIIKNQYLTRNTRNSYASIVSLISRISSLSFHARETSITFVTLLTRISFISLPSLSSRTLFPLWTCGELLKR